MSAWPGLPVDVVRRHLTTAALAVVSGPRGWDAEGAPDPAPVHGCDENVVATDRRDQASVG